MARALLPEEILDLIDEGRLSPYYLFHGEDDFRIERALRRIRDALLTESARDFNLEIFYGGETQPEEIIGSARSVPFLANTRLIIVRGTEKFDTESLEKFLPYLERPSDSTCVIFVSDKPDFKRKFYKKLKSLGVALPFKQLKDRDIVPWIQNTAQEMGLKLDTKTCFYILELVGNSTRDLYAELEKVHLRYGNSADIEKVKELVIHSRMYSVFELVDMVAEKNCGKSLSALNRFLEEEDKKFGPLRIIGMLNRQIRLLWQTKTILDKGGSQREIAGKLGHVGFLAGKLTRQSRRWTAGEFEKALALLYEADRYLKSGSRPRPVLENLIITLCE
ncbi:MAG: DNA polymerase III subunit delta [Deltaproteobacteria bacterium]|nr:DNA polymerase III subunit delta [Deltaproteobacteria bacterium]MBW1921116.1 DNA polymerase III subunit delta [Deltaproteobacteria bacterium]MBW1935818.1 DNA polymerase III subunit delta [Deltaproteobacteria bacterium]MBW1978794.1 DNA polymerase III subunit delta [Deltaproteobacteria bacterium]MBW2045486.1 DNA polymerase III subunit delta [Deltaproteobacteria bacterium]